jgi:hypothetical protein
VPFIHDRVYVHGPNEDKTNGVYKRSILKCDREVEPWLVSLDKFHTTTQAPYISPLRRFLLKLKYLNASSHIRASIQPVRESDRAFHTVFAALALHMCRKTIRFSPGAHFDFRRRKYMYQVRNRLSAPKSQGSYGNSPTLRAYSITSTTSGRSRTTSVISKSHNIVIRFIQRV